MGNCPYRLERNVLAHIFPAEEQETISECKAMHDCISHEVSDLQVKLCSASDLVAAYGEIWSYIGIQASAGKLEVDERIFEIVIKAALLRPWAVCCFFKCLS